MKAAPVRTPVLILPGIGGVFPKRDPASVQAWTANRGADPTTLVVDPLAGVYDRLINSFKAAGYREGWICSSPTTTGG